MKNKVNNGSRGGRRVLLGAAAAVFALMLPMNAEASKHTYTYNYDYWEDVQDSSDFYNCAKVYTSSELGLDVRMKNPQGLYAHGDFLYICDTGNNRIIEIRRDSSETLEVTRIIDSFKGGKGPNDFVNPTDIAISEDGNIFIADQGNARILKLDKDLNYIMEFIKPDDNTLDAKLVFQPFKIAIDTAERVYCVAKGINKGLVKYEADGTFSGFVGATPVTFDFMDYVWKKLATQEQRAKMENFVPTEYENLYMDYEGFIYVVTTSFEEEDLRNEKVNTVRKLNLMGNDILVRNGDFPVFGDLYWGNGGGHEGASLFTDVTAMENDIYVCLDRNRGRLFGYNDQGQLVFAFGGNGNMDGYFSNPSGIEHIGHDLYVLDQKDCALTVFAPTAFGELVYKAIEEFDQGNYTLSGESWEEVMKLNGNYDLAYIGIGRSLLRQERYHEAMKYFEIKYDDENYSKAFKQYRKEWVEEHIGGIVFVIVLLFLIPLGIGRAKAIKWEIDKAEKAGEI